MLAKIDAYIDTVGVIAEQLKRIALALERTEVSDYESNEDIDLDALDRD